MSWPWAGLHSRNDGHEPGESHVFDPIAHGSEDPITHTDPTVAYPAGQALAYDVLAGARNGILCLWFNKGTAITSSPFDRTWYRTSDKEQLGNPMTTEHL